MKKFDLRKIGEISFGVINGVAFINTTPHDVTFGDVDFTTVLPKSNVLINAKPVKEEIGESFGVKFSKTSFVGTDEEKEKIIALREDILKEEGVNFVVIVGSIIAMNAFPGLVAGLVPVPGYERVSPAEKRMSLKEFSIS